MERVLELFRGTTTLELTEIIARLVLTFFSTSVVAWIYSWNYRGYGRPSQLGIVLVLVSLATSGIIMAIGDNLALSLGMVGALSIVRFRAAVRDNRDLAYLFWALSLGLVCGSGGYQLALCLLVVIGVAIVVLERGQMFRADTGSYIVILARERSEDQVGWSTLLPPEATLKSSTYHRDTNVEEASYLVHFSDSRAVEQFQQQAASHPGLRRYQVLSPDDAILG